jgi:hypothetical protein
MLVIGLAGGSLIFLVVVVAIVIVIAFTYYTRRGNRGIDPHPYGGVDAPGASEPSDATGPGRIPEDHDHVDDPGRIPTHGTK